jgi:hypothetical protein
MSVLQRILQLLIAALCLLMNGAFVWLLQTSSRPSTAHISEDYTLLTAQADKAARLQTRHMLPHAWVGDDM